MIYYGEDFTDHSKSVRLHSWGVLEFCDPLDITLKLWKEIFKDSDKMAWYQITQVYQKEDNTWETKVYGEKRPIKEVIKINVKKPTATGQYIKTPPLAVNPVNFYWGEAVLMNGNAA